MTTAAEPLYIRTAEAIRRQLVECGLEPGSPIEPESILVRELGISRVTLRRAIDILVDDQLLVRRQGIGTFLAPQRITYPLVGLHSTRDLARAHGVELRVEILKRVVGTASAEERANLRLGPGARVVRFVRRDFHRSRPICVAACSLPARYADCLTAEALRASSSYELIERAHGLRLTSARQVMRAEPATRRNAELLGCRPGRPLFVLERLTLDRDAEPVEWARLSYRHDRAECAVDLEREPAGRRESPTNVVLRFPTASARRSAKGAWPPLP